MSPTAATFIARSVHGLEWLAAAELESRGARVSRVAHRALWFNFAELPEPTTLAGLRTVDDVFLVLGELPNVARDRSALARLRAWDLDLSSAVALLASWRPVETRTFTVVASALGKRKYGRFELESALGAALARSGWSFEDSRLGTAESRRLSVRLHVDADAFVALRVFQHPLHRRAYRTDTHVAALRPPVAAGMSLLGALLAGQRLHDPFCGDGTIPIEAELHCPGVIASGSDLDAARITSARANAQRAACRARFQLAACSRLDLDARSVDAIVSNPPWDQKVELAGRQPGSHWLRNVTPVLAPAGRLVLLSTDPKGLESVACEVGW
jgi:tRNA (guanine6-N2)-methyltransferase